MSAPFAGIMAAARWNDAGFTAAVPEAWLQGRTAYGGFSAALAVEAARHVGGDGLPPLRSAVVSFVGPVSGDVGVSARVLRKGKNATWIAAELETAAGVGLAATFVFMGPVASALQFDERPAPPGLLAVDKAPVHVFNDLTPLFLRNNFEVRQALPRDRRARGEMCWWVRLVDRTGIDPMTEILLVADSLPPGVLPLLHAGVPVSSMTWQANLLTAAPATDDGWWLLRSTGDYAEHGCSSQAMGIWNTSGEPVVSGMQSVALFG